MSMMGRRLLLGGGGPRPIDIWAVGAYQASEQRPIVFYKPKHRPWQLQYIGAALPSNHRAQFQSGSRFAGDPAGTIWVGCWRNQLSSSAVNKLAAMSTDFGVTWTYVDAPAGFSVNGGLIYGCCALGAGRVIVSRWESSLNSSGVFYGTTAGLNYSTKVAGGGSVNRATPDFLFLPAATSPNGADTIVMIVDAEVLTSLDYGATFTVVATLSDINGGGTGNGNALNVRISAAHPKFDGLKIILQAYAPGTGTVVLPGQTRIVTSDDLVNWEVQGIPSSTWPCGLGVTRRKIYRNVSSAGLPFSPAWRVDRSNDAGSTWTPVGGDGALMTRCRYLGNRFFAVVGDKIYSSSNGSSWPQETLPDAGVGTITFYDVFG